jgi:hypothetical protein
MNPRPALHPKPGVAPKPDRSGIILSAWPRRLFPSEIPWATYRLDVRFAGGLSYPNAPYDVYDRQKTCMGSHGPQARLAAIALRTSIVLALRRRHSASHVTTISQALLKRGALVSGLHRYGGDVQEFLYQAA